MHMYEIAMALREALENIEVDEDGVVTGMEAYELLEGDFTEKMEALAIVFKEESARADALKAELKALQGRVKACERKAESFKNYMTNMLQITGEKSMETARVKLSFRKSTAVEVDEDKLPRQWMVAKTTYAPDKKLLKESLEKGEYIPGAQLVVKENLQIK